MLICATLFAVCSAFYFVYETQFLYYQGYDSLIGIDVVPSEYIRLEILSVIETALLSLVLIMLAALIHSYIFKHTGLERTNINYSTADRKYHVSLLIQNYVFMTLGILAAIAKCVCVFAKTSHGVATFEIDFTTYVSILPKLEWIGLVSAVLTFAYIGFSFYFTSTLKDEVEMKYNIE